MTELEKLREALDSAGISAEMHARLRKRIVDVLHANQKMPVSEKSEEAKVLISAIADFFDSENLEFSKSVLASETAVEFMDRRQLQKQLKFPGSEDACILSSLLKTVFEKPELVDASTQTKPKEKEVPTSSPLSSSFETSF